MNQEDKTIQSLFNVWFWNFQNPNTQQLSNMYHATKAIIKFYNKDKMYDKNLAEMEEMFFKPIETLKKKHPLLTVSENCVDWNINCLETIYYRDSRFLTTKLSTEYFVDSSKPQFKKRIKFSELITVLSLFKTELTEFITALLIDKKIELTIPFQANILGDLSTMIKTEP